MDYLNYKVNPPQWREVATSSHLPVGLEHLKELAYNYWWTWNHEVADLFSSLDNELWEQGKHNPVMLLEQMNYDKLEALTCNKAFMECLENIYTRFRAYMDVPVDQSRPSVAYFSMEYGLSKVLKIYSGGLGILAGDYLKEASDSNVNLCAVGLLYRYGYFNQSLSMDGEQTVCYEAQNFGQLPIEKVLTEDGRQMVVHIPYTDYFVVHANVWRANVGRITLYLLDTDNEMNSEYDRSITHHLYGGSWEDRLKQEILLGIGGMMLLRQLGLNKDIFHCNEGHAALLNLYRLSEYTKQGMSFAQAMELVRASSLYTVHTPVSAGHDYFDEDLFRKYLGQYATRLGISWETLMGLGRYDMENVDERFCMSVFACKTSQEVNGVSLLHENVSRRMFAPIWKGYFPEELHIGHVTNGVHMPTWCVTEWKGLYKKYFDNNFSKQQSDKHLWEAIYDVPDEEVWNTRLQMKRRLIEYLKKKCADDLRRNQTDPRLVASIVEKFNPNALLIGFARRFATYKRAYLLFSDLERLSRIVNNKERPVQFIFAGKAHPNDVAGQGLIRQIVEISRRPEFQGKIIFLENYDMELARRLVSGVDVWLNTPTRLAEASGTSGEKALMNGVLNLSVLDGWWYEGYCKEAGWAIPAETVYQHAPYQDQLDANIIYYLLENQILPLYYQTDGKEYSEEWVQYIKNSIAQIAPYFTMRRQLDDYYEKFYCKMNERFSLLSKCNNEKARLIADWKQNVATRWDDIEIKSIKGGNGLKAVTKAGEDYEITIIVDEKGLDDAIGIECVATHMDNGRETVYSIIPFKLIGHDGSDYTFRAQSHIANTGSFKLSFRMYPKHKLLPHRQDFCYVRWF